MFSCQGKNETIFKGEVFIVENKSNTDVLYGQQIKFNEIYTGHISVYDSLIVFSSKKYGDHYSSVFNLKTGERINLLIKLGQGDNEYNGIHCESEFQADTAISLWYYDGFHKKHGILVDLKNNLIQNCIDFSGLPDDEKMLTRFFILNDSLLLAWHQEEELFEYDNMVSPALWSLFNYKTNEKLMQYDVFNNFRYHNMSFCLGSHDIIKPDHTKLVMTMSYLRQINIVDITTGVIKGFRVKGSPDFAYVTNSSYKDLTEYYIRSCADDNFIYAMLQKMENTVVDVFDWNGNYLKTLTLDKKMIDKDSNIALDPINKYLYILVVGEKEEETYRYDVSYLYKQ
jgi:hypothetical protein